MVFAGNIGEMQSVDTIIKAANEVRTNTRIIFHIVGEGSSRIACQNLATELKLENVIFHGQFPITDMPRFYGLADAFLITLKDNKAISYTLPNKVQSYMAAGKPIIGAINGETARIVKEADCGLCTPAEDYLLLAESIRNFADNKQEYERFGENAKRYYSENFTIEKFMDNLNRYLKR